MKRIPVVAGNWKMNGTRAGVEKLVQAVRAGADQVTTAELIVFPPYVFLPMVEKALANSSITWGGQDLSAEKNGAFTGDVSAEMLLEFGCQYVLIGHSERRQLHQEDDELIVTKTARALQAGIIPIICIGETLKQRDAGQTLTVIIEQVAAILQLKDKPGFEKIMFAYEPVWAIGTGRSATPEQAQEVHRAIRDQISEANEGLANKTRILYGGSVKPENAAMLFAMADIDGALVGGASLEADKFLQIGKLCNS